MKRIILSAAILFASLFCASAQDYTGKLPAKFTVSLDFTQGWPFATERVKPANQTEEGEAYEYKVSGGKKGGSIFFTLCKGPNENTYSLSRKNVCLDFLRPESKPDNCGYIRIPAVDGRYVASIELTIATKATKIFVCSAPEKVKKGAGLVCTMDVPDKGTGRVELTPDQLDGGTALYLYRQGNGAFRCTSLKVSYASLKGKKK